MIRIITDRSYAVGYMRPYEYDISCWLNERDIDSYFDRLTTDRTITPASENNVKISLVVETNFVCFKEEQDALAFVLVFGEHNMRGYMSA